MERYLTTIQFTSSEKRGVNTKSVTVFVRSCELLLWNVVSSHERLVKSCANEICFETYGYTRMWCRIVLGFNIRPPLQFAQKQDLLKYQKSEWLKFQGIIYTRPAALSGVSMQAVRKRMFSCDSNIRRSVDPRGWRRGSWGGQSQACKTWNKAVTVLFTWFANMAYLKSVLWPMEIRW